MRLGQLASRSCLRLLRGISLDFVRDENLAEDWKDVMGSLMSWRMVILCLIF